MGYMLETRGLTKRFGRGDQAQDAVADVSLHIREGEVYGLLGPNGAGKSTTLKMICGMLRPTAGEILFAGHAWRREDLYAIGSLIEEAPLYPNLTARENLRVRTTLLGLPESRVDEVLAAVDLADTGKKRAGRFSMGMRQRLGLALALIARPRLLVLDEPTNGLDPAGMRELRDTLKYLAENEGIAVFVSSHILSEMQLLCDRVCIISAGNILRTCNVDELLDEQNHGYRFILRPADAALSVLESKLAGRLLAREGDCFDIDCEEPEVPDLISFFLQSGANVYGVQPAARSLEDSFMEITGGGNTIA